jgi:hypothetical protein
VVDGEYEGSMDGLKKPKNKQPHHHHPHHKAQQQQQQQAVAAAQRVVAAASAEREGGASVARAVATALARVRRAFALGVAVQ